MQLLEDNELTTLGIVNNLDLLEQTNEVEGFGAVLYRDYITGENQFSLALRGTDAPPSVDGWADWINNLQQGLGLVAEQYLAAMELADELRTLVPFLNNHLIVTGHSLGGGLASAMVVGGLRRHVQCSGIAYQHTLSTRR